MPRVPIEIAATGPKVIELAARRADRICFAVGANPSRLVDCMARALGRGGGGPGPETTASASAPT